ncbi:hypothetical protein [Shewanella gelidii]|uniref:Uncharacterized protein n=1 Tax=Shewanella gelidii TaxID=1642821 RepID=A0A917NE79_9GAMM|nr:hypothetical protein [Shewanella gelidii]MCL1098083.1 hypothetical protein [Shewanella gelidii]MCL1098090.1 hypothetical protein [Shewanella gelidii]GGI93551.1 hypothetical protein GCM10009332_33490 [Shewanella gelidii]
MESECTVLLSSDVFKVAIGALIGLTGSLIVTMMTYRIETTKMRANHRASIIKEAQLAAHDHFSALSDMINTLQKYPTPHTVPQSVVLEEELNPIFEKMHLCQKEMHRKSSQLKSIGLIELADKATDCVKPIESFATSFSESGHYSDLLSVAGKMNSLEDVFLESVNNEYKKLKL